MIVIFFALVSLLRAETEVSAGVCLGRFLGKILYSDTNRPYITIGDFGPFHYEQGDKPNFHRLTLDDLDPLIIYTVRVHVLGKIVTSWELDFTKQDSDTVNIWRSAGAWRMDLINREMCEE